MNLAFIMLLTTGSRAMEDMTCVDKDGVHRSAGYSGINEDGRACTCRMTRRRLRVRRLAGASWQECVDDPRRELAPAVEPSAAAEDYSDEEFLEGWSTIQICLITAAGVLIVTLIGTILRLVLFKDRSWLQKRPSQSSCPQLSPAAGLEHQYPAQDQDISYAACIAQSARNVIDYGGMFTPKPAMKEPKPPKAAKKMKKEPSPRTSYDASPREKEPKVAKKMKKEPPKTGLDPPKTEAFAMCIGRFG